MLLTGPLGESRPYGFSVESLIKQCIPYSHKSVEDSLVTINSPTKINMMNTSQKLIALLSGAALLSISSLAAQTATTAPVGYVTSTAADASDTYVGTVLSEQIALTSVASGVAGAVVSTASTLVEDAYNATHYVLFTTGAKDGQWYEVVDTTTNSVVLETDVAALGVTTGDEFKVIKFWTLATLFPSSSGFAVSVNPFSPVAQVLLNNLEATGINLSSASSYFYHDGSSPILSNTAGWYKTGALSSAAAVRLTPETYFTIRNQSGSDFDVVVSGSVPVEIVGTGVVSAASAQDNQLVNPYPSALSLDASGLTNVVTSSPNPFSPGDQVLLFANEGTGINRSSLASYFYHDGSSPILSNTAGWYKVGSLVASGAIEIPAGGAFWIRKAAASPSLAEWAPAVPYSL